MWKQKDVELTQPDEIEVEKYAKVLDKPKMTIDNTPVSTLRSNKISINYELYKYFRNSAISHSISTIKHFNQLAFCQKDDIASLYIFSFTKFTNTNFHFR